MGIQKTNFDQNGRSELLPLGSSIQLWNPLKNTISVLGNEVHSWEEGREEGGRGGEGIALLIGINHFGFIG